MLQIKIFYNFLNFMIFAGKCLNVIAGNRCSKRCYLCWKTSAELRKNPNDFEILAEKRENLKLGPSLLYAEIHCMEQFNKLSYRLKVRSWDVLQATKGKQIHYYS